VREILKKPIKGSRLKGAELSSDIGETVSMLTIGRGGSPSTITFTGGEVAKNVRMASRPAAVRAWVPGGGWVQLKR
jgi:hypothetical protein